MAITIFRRNYERSTFKDEPQTSDKIKGCKEFATAGGEDNWQEKAPLTLKRLRQA